MLRLSVGGLHPPYNSQTRLLEPTLIKDIPATIWAVPWITAAEMSIREGLPRGPVVAKLA
jgi:hypothetical protein